MLYDKKHVYIRSPLRISFIGGGTDMESYYLNGNKGHVVSSAVDLYVYIAIKDMFDANIRVHHSKIETQPITSRIMHTYTRTALEHFGIFKGAEVVITSDVMTTGSGLGASSSLMSALAKGCSNLRDTHSQSKSNFAELIYSLECKAGTVGGKQDQYATIFGGLNSISFTDKEVKVNPVKISLNRKLALESRLLLIFTNLARESKQIQLQLDTNIKSKNREYLDRLKNLSYDFLKVLETESEPIHKVGDLLHEGWVLKKSSNKASSNQFIDQLYDMLRSKGVLGGKIMGAGGGGFFLAFIKEPSLKQQIKYELYPNYIAMDVKFAEKGTEVLWKNF